MDWGDGAGKLVLISEGAILSLSGNVLNSSIWFVGGSSDTCIRWKSKLRHCLIVVFGISTAMRRKYVMPIYLTATARDCSFEPVESLGICPIFPNMNIFGNRTFLRVHYLNGHCPVME